MQCGAFGRCQGSAEMLEQRYPPLQPDIDRLIQLPHGSLGRGNAELIRRLHYDPEFFRPRPIVSKAQWPPSGWPPPTTSTTW